MAVVIIVLTITIRVVGWDTETRRKWACKPLIVPNYAIMFCDIIINSKLNPLIKLLQL